MLAPGDDVAGPRSFVLTDTLEIRRIKPLNELAENADAAGKNDDERFDADFALFGLETGNLANALTAALGGEKANA